jgi:predicted ArsR family transcriptional regulator
MSPLPAERQAPHRAAPEAPGVLLTTLKRHGPLAATGVARQLHITREAARQQLALLEREGRVMRHSEPARGRGRPQVRFALTPMGEELFPKNYDALSLTLVDTVAEQFGQEALTKLLTALTDQQVRLWEPKLRDKPLAARIRALKGIYFKEDPFTSMRKDGRGYVLLEHNCPYLHLALRRPRLCSVTLSTLSRLLGVRVVRESRFQDGDGHCAFRILADDPIDAAFRFAYEDMSSSLPRK